MPRYRTSNVFTDDDFKKGVKKKASKAKLPPAVHTYSPYDMDGFDFSGISIPKKVQDSMDIVTSVTTPGDSKELRIRKVFVALLQVFVFFSNFRSIHEQYMDALTDMLGDILGWPRGVYTSAILTLADGRRKYIKNAVNAGPTKLSARVPITLRLENKLAELIDRYLAIPKRPPLPLPPGHENADEILNEYVWTMREFIASTLHKLFFEPPAIPTVITHAKTSYRDVKAVTGKPTDPTYALAEKCETRQRSATPDSECSLFCSQRPNTRARSRSSSPAPSRSDKDAATARVRSRSPIRDTSATCSGPQSSAPVWTPETRQSVKERNESE
jgi:hypothetical protein